MNKPDWNDAPEWARWLAMDSDGRWYWYEYEPHMYDTQWGISEGHAQFARKESHQWKETLEERPQ